MNEAANKRIQQSKVSKSKKNYSIQYYSKVEAKNDQTIRSSSIRRTIGAVVYHTTRGRPSVRSHPRGTHRSPGRYHGTPTRPLVETALGLIQTNIGQKTIVGWYTAPALLQDTKAGPVALRMVANLETDDVEPVLLVLQNEKLAACRKGEGTAENLLKAFGKDDLGGQWVRPLECTIKDASSAIEQMKTGTSSSPTIHDFVDHLEGSASTPWVTL